MAVAITLSDELCCPAAYALGFDLADELEPDRRCGTVVDDGGGTAGADLKGTVDAIVHARLPEIVPVPLS